MLLFTSCVADLTSCSCNALSSNLPRLCTLLSQRRRPREAADVQPGGQAGDHLPHRSRTLSRSHATVSLRRNSFRSVGWLVCRAFFLCVGASCIEDADRKQALNDTTYVRERNDILGSYMNASTVLTFPERAVSRIKERHVEKRRVPRNRAPTPTKRQRVDFIAMTRAEHNLRSLVYSTINRLPYCPMMEATRNSSGTSRHELRLINCGG